MSDKTGGSAFPNINSAVMNESGMTLRDYMAGQATFDVDELSENQAQAIVGYDNRLSKSDLVKRIKWWAEVEAKIRYIKADAMLKARE